MSDSILPADFPAFAKRVNDHLANGGTVVISTASQHTRYGKRHAGIFRGANRSLYAGKVCIGSSVGLLVGVTIE